MEKKENEDDQQDTSKEERRKQQTRKRPEFMNLAAELSSCSIKARSCEGLIGVFFSSDDRLTRLASLDNSDATIGLFCLLTGTRTETFVADLALLSVVSEEDDDEEEEDDEEDEEDDEEEGEGC